MPRNLVHGRKARVYLDDLTGALTDVSAVFDKFEVKEEADRPETQGAGHDAKRYGSRGKVKADMTGSGKVALAAGHARLHGRKGVWLAGGSVLSRAVKSGSIDLSCDLPATSGAEDFERYEVVGLTAGSVSIQARAEYGVGESADVLDTALKTDPDVGQLPYLALGVNGLGLGKAVEFWRTAVTSVSGGHDNSQVNMISAESQAHDGVWLGLSLHDLVAEIAPAPLDLPGIDDQTATVLGARIRVHVTAIAGAAPSVTFKCQTSADGAVWADLATFDPMTAPGAQEIEIAPGVTLNRYMRLVISAGAYDSVTFTSFIYRAGATNAVPGGYRHLRGLLGADETTSFKHQPDGVGVGKREKTGECRLASLKLQFDTDQVIGFDASFSVDGAVTTTRQA